VYVTSFNSRDSVVSVVIRLWTERSGVRIPAGREIFLFCKRSRPALGPSRWVPGLKRSGGDIYHSPPSSVEVMKVWSHTFTPLYAFMSWTGKTLPLPDSLWRKWNIRCQKSLYVQLVARINNYSFHAGLWLN